MKNENIGALIDLISPLKLSIEESSARRRVIRLLSGFRDDYNIEADYIKKDLAEKNPDGSVKIFQNLIQFTKENRKAADKKMEELNNLQIDIDWKGEEKDKETIRTILQRELAKENKESLTDVQQQGLDLYNEILDELK